MQKVYLLLGSQATGNKFLQSLINYLIVKIPGITCREQVAQLVSPLKKSFLAQ